MSQPKERECASTLQNEVRGQPRRAAADISAAFPARRVYLSFHDLRFVPVVGSAEKKVAKPRGFLG